MREAIPAEVQSGLDNSQVAPALCALVARRANSAAERLHEADRTESSSAGSVGGHG